MRVLRTAKATLSRTFYLDEVATDATGAVAVAVTRLDGTAVESGTATSMGGGVYEYAFTGRDVLDELVLTWSATVGGDAIVLDQDRIEIVGGFYFGLAEARNIDRVLTDTTKFPTADLIGHRIATENECERITGQAWVPRFSRETLSGDGSTTLKLGRPLVRVVRSVAVAGFAQIGYEPSDLGLLYLSTGWPRGHNNVIIEYEHGHDRPDPEIVRGAKLRFKSIALEGRSALPDRAERVVTVDQAGGSVVYGQPGVDKTGIPAVDAIYRAFPAPQPGFG